MASLSEVESSIRNTGDDDKMSELVELAKKLVGAAKVTFRIPDIVTVSIGGAALVVAVGGVWLKYKLDGPAAGQHDEEMGAVQPARNGAIVIPPVRPFVRPHPQGQSGGTVSSAQAQDIADSLRFQAPPDEADEDELEPFYDALEYRSEEI